MAVSQKTRGTRRRIGATVRTERAQAHKWRREMIALKTMLMIAGVSLLAAALVFPLYGVWMRLRYAQLKRSRDEGMLVDTGSAEPERSPIEWRQPVALALVA